MRSGSERHSRSRFAELLRRLRGPSKARKTRSRLRNGIGAEFLEARLFMSGNAAPINGVSGDQSTQVNVPLSFTALGQNQLSVADADAGDTPIEVTLTAQHGVVSLLNPDPGSNVQFSVGDGVNDVTMTLTGTLTDINRALQWAVFTPDADYVGDASVTVTSNDLNLDSGDPGIDTDVIAIDVKPVTTASQVFNVLDFGAVGDGSVDDAPAIRATIAAAKAAGGGTIFFPPGAYRLDTFVPNGSPTAHFHITNCEGIKFSGVGAHLNSTSRLNTYVFYLNGVRNIEFEGFTIDGQFARSAHTITQPSVGAFFIASTARDTDSVRIVDVNVTDSYFFLICASNLSTPWRARNISVDRCSFTNGFYGLNFQNNGDNVTARDFRTMGVARSYFPFGVDSHHIEYVSTGGNTLTDCLIKAYQRDTTNISVRLKVVDNTSADSKCTLESQHDPSLQPVPARLQNIQVHFDDAESMGPKSVRFAYYRDTPNPTQTAVSPTNLFDQIVIDGRARNPTDIAVREELPGVVDQSRLEVLPALTLSSTYVLENLPRPTTIGTLATLHAPTDETYTFSLVPGLGSDDNPIFDIVEDQLVTVASFNYELRQSYTVRVRATSPGGVTIEQAFTISIGDVNEYSLTAVADFDPTANSIPEDAANGTPIGVTAYAVDLDGTNNLVTYSLTENAGGRFVINSFTGVISVKDASKLDYESAASHSLKVRAKSADGTISEMTVIVRVQDVNEFGISPISDTDTRAASIPEGSPFGTRVGITASAMDNDGSNNRVTYSLWSDASSRFTIHPTTGVVTVADSTLLDREAAASWTITVVATSEDGSASASAFVIELLDVDEFNVGQVFDLDAAPNVVAENSAGGTTVGLTGFGIDLDATNNGVRYSLLYNAEGRFNIHPTTGVVTVAAGASLDYETFTSHLVTVKATSSDGSFSTQSFTIEVSDVSDVPEVVLSDNSVAENSPVGTVVGNLGVAQMSVTSPVFTLVKGTGGTDNAKFTIRGNQIVTKASLNFEAKASYSIRVQMRDASGRTLIQVFTIQVANVNEAPTKLTLGGLAAGERIEIGSNVATLSGADPDAGDHFSYSLVDGSGSTDNARFTIEGNRLVAAQVILGDRKRSYSIRVRITDANGLSIEKVVKFKVLARAGR